MSKRGFSLEGWEEKNALERVLLVIALCDGAIAVLLAVLQLIGLLDAYVVSGPMFLIYFLLMAYEDRRERANMWTYLICGGLLLALWLAGLVL